jgi:predicted acetyltransferase
VSVEIRYAHRDELPAVMELDGASFGIEYAPDDVKDVLLDIDVDRMLVAIDGAVDGSRIVAASCEVPFTMTLPGGSVDTMGLTWVSVEVTHRRRGILRALIEGQLRSAADRGVAVSVLTASEASIYGRFGYGVATRTATTVIDRRAARLAQPRAEHGVMRCTTDQVRTVLPELYDRWRRVTPGALDRDDDRWQLALLEREWSRQGRTGLFHLVHADGYVSYRMGRAEDVHGHGKVCSIVDYVVCSRDAHAGLWQVLLSLDLCSKIETDRMPLDDPLRHLLTDPRQVTTTALSDGLWARPLDVPALLAARRYALDVDVVLQVRDPLLGDGTYRLVGGPDGATCAATTATAEVDLTVAALGAAVLGGTRLGELARAGQVHGSSSAITRLDRAFLAEVEPQFGTYF